MFEWASGKKYIGFWENGKQHGKGKKREGVWEAGKRVKWVGEGNDEIEKEDASPSL